jgi:primosomal protein N' (replication factor Y)
MGGRVIVQTYNAQHYAIVCAARHDYEGFAVQELEERQLLGLPPERRAALLLLTSEAETAAATAAQRIAQAVATLAADSGVDVRGPAKAPIERVRGRWRYMLLLLGRSAGALARTYTAARTVKLPRNVDLTLDVDPAAVL